MEHQLYNIEYEKALLGILLLDNSLIDIVKGRLSRDSFYNPKYKQIFKAIVEQWENDKCTNALTLSSVLPHFVADISELTDIGSTENWEFYTNKIQTSFLARVIKNDLNDVLGTLNEENSIKIVEELSTKVNNYLKYEGDKGAKMQDLCLSIPQEIQKAYTEQRELLGYSSGWKQIDDILDGFQTGKLYVVGARPSIGKTAFAMNLLANFARKGIPCTAFSLEMSARMLFFRMLAVESKLPINQLLKGDCMAYQGGLRKLEIGLTNLYKFPINIIDTDTEEEQKIYSTIRYEAQVKGTKVFMIDHLGLVESMNKTEQAYRQVGHITKNLHKLAKELDVVIIILCQLNREAEGKKPSMNLLRESGNIEQDADVIMFLYRERDMEETQIPTEIIIEKNRDGKLGVAKMLFLSTFTKFIEEVSTREENEVA